MGAGCGHPRRDADLVVGANGAMSFTGRAYVYLGGAAGPAAAPAARFTGPDGTYGHFGVSVASAGNANDRAVASWDGFRGGGASLLGPKLPRWLATDDRLCAGTAHVDVHGAALHHRSILRTPQACRARNGVAVPTRRVASLSR
jgi:hypothetical protein